MVSTVSQRGRDCLLPPPPDDDCRQSSSLPVDKLGVNVRSITLVILQLPF